MTPQLKFLRHQLRKNAQACLGCRQSESDTRGNKWERCEEPSDALCHMPSAVRGTCELLYHVDVQR